MVGKTIVQNGASKIFFFDQCGKIEYLFYNLLLYIPLPFSDNMYICLRQVMEGRNGNGAKTNNKSSVSLGDIGPNHLLL